MRVAPNRSDKVVSDGLPYVIFGDHTRRVKFVDLPFVLGADGTKPLKPDQRVFDPKFFYWALRSLHIPSRACTVCSAVKRAPSAEEP